MELIRAPSNMADDVYSVPGLLFGNVFQVYTDRERDATQGLQLAVGKAISFDVIQVDFDGLACAVSVAVSEDQIGYLIFCKLLVAEGGEALPFAMRRFRSLDLAYNRWADLLDIALASGIELLLEVARFRLPGTPDIRHGMLGEPQTPYGQQWQDGQSEAGPDLYWGGHYKAMRNPC